MSLRLQIPLALYGRVWRNTNSAYAFVIWGKYTGGESWQREVVIIHHYFNGIYGGKNLDIALRPSRRVLVSLKGRLKGSCADFVGEPVLFMVSVFFMALVLELKLFQLYLLRYN